MSIRRSYFFITLAVYFILSGLVPFDTPAADTFPARPVKIITPFPPGGVCDLHARALQAGLEPVTNQTMMVINKKGAGGAIGMQYASLQKPDGYTIMTALSSEPYMHEVDTGKVHLTTNYFRKKN